MACHFGCCWGNKLWDVKAVEQFIKEGLLLPILKDLREETLNQSSWAIIEIDENNEHILENKTML